MRPASIVALVLTWSVAARADLEGDARRLAEGWVALGQEIVERRAVFLEPGKIAPLVSRGAALGDAPCVSVAVIASRGRDVSVALGLLRSAFEPTKVVASPGALGVGFVTGCGAAQADPREAAVELMRARGAVELVVARGPVPAPHPAEILRERAPGLLAHPVDPGRARDETPLAARVEAVLARDRREERRADGVSVALSSDAGAGAVEVEVAAGCHTLTVLAGRGLGGQVADVDAELTDPTGRRVLARDRAEAPDAQLFACLAEPIRARLAFSGAPPRTDVALVRSSVPLISALPAWWPARARAAASALLQSRPGPRGLGAPTAHAGGTVGTTLVSLDLVPGCQRVVVAASQGEPRAVLVSAHAGGRTHRDDGGVGRAAGALMLCPHEAERVMVRVDARGPGVGWVLAAFPVTTDPIGPR